MEVGEALQRAVFAKLTADDGMRAAFGGDAPRVYDAVPPPLPSETDAAYQRRLRFPYVTIGDDEIIDDSTSCATAYEAAVTVHVWSRAVGRIEAKRIAGAVRDALDAALLLDCHVVTEHAHRSTRFVRDPDGVTTHAVVELRYLIDPQ